jgi:hypothetical protein
MYKTKIILFSTMAAILTVSIVVLTLTLSSAYHDQRYAKSHQGCLPGQINHKVTIENDIVSPLHTTATKCDTLTITNLDTTRRDIAFGVHDKHIAYDGISEQALIKDQSLTVTLVQTGDFIFHDHMHDEVRGTFSVR